MTTLKWVVSSVLVSMGLFVGSACAPDPSFTGGCPVVQPKDICTSADNFAGSLAYVTPEVVHTGWNGRDTYEAVLVANFGQFEVDSADYNITCIARFDCPPAQEQGVIALLTTKGPGNTTVTVESRDFKRTIDVVVTEYTPAQYDLGQGRYSNPTDANGTDRRACGNCHLGGGGAPHSPLALARFTDAELVFVTQNSKYPDTCENNDGDVCNCTPVGEDCSACSQECNYNKGFELSLAAFGGGPGDHTFNLTADEEVGIMAYMRAIDPEGI